MLRLVLLLCLPVLALVLFASCNTQAPQNPANASNATPAPTPGTFANIDADRFEQISRQPGVVLLDVRTPAEFAEGHIKGAVNIDSASADFSRKSPPWTRAKPTSSIAAPDAAPPRRTEMAGTGFPRLYNLDGGINAYATPTNPSKITAPFASSLDLGRLLRVA